MSDIHTSETEVSAVSARNGPILLYQGFFKQALYLSRENIPLFVKDPEQAPVVVLPPFVSLALRCHAPWDQVDEITLTRDFSIDESYHMTIRNRGGPTARFYSDHDNMPGPRTLRADSINVVVTPKITALVDTSSFEPRLAVIVEQPEAEKPSYRARFAHDVTHLRNAVIHAIDHHQPNKNYEST